jgi:hypothetical protein
MKPLKYLNDQRSVPEMIDSKSDRQEAEAPRGRVLWMRRGVLAGVCVLVLGVYVYTAHPGYVVSLNLNPADAYYNLLVQGFRDGQLNMKTDVPRGLAELADPYDPSAHAHYPVGDMSYYKGKLYLYYGVTPACVAVLAICSVDRPLSASKRRRCDFLLCRFPG